LIFAHPGSRYFTVGRIGADQLRDYAERRVLPRSEVENWLRPNLD
jgi:5-methyltetrahydrofolate--homocysteine methyltransferase